MNRCDAHDIEGLRCTRNVGHSSVHESVDRQGRRWGWTIDHGPIQKTVVTADA